MYVLIHIAMNCHIEDLFLQFEIWELSISMGALNEHRYVWNMTEFMVVWIKLVVDWQVQHQCFNI